MFSLVFETLFLLYLKIVFFCISNIFSFVFVKPESSRAKVNLRPEHPDHCDNRDNCDNRHNRHYCDQSSSSVFNLLILSMMMILMGMIMMMR